MSLNKVKGNMYSWVTHTWNTVKGACPHGCHYCYMRRFGEQKPVRFDEKELKTNLGSGNFIFVGSGCDMWANQIEHDWISETLQHCMDYNNRYLFQSKNPERIHRFHDVLPGNSVIGTTIESNIRHPQMGYAPDPLLRAEEMADFKTAGYETTITIEPVMKFDLLSMVGIISACKPDFVNIGANTNPKVRLPEPTKQEVLDLIGYIEELTTVKLKSNLKRILGKDMEAPK